MRSLKSILSVCALTLAAAGANAEVVVIVNPKNPAANLSAEQVAALYLGNASTFPDGGAATLADQP